MKGEAVWELVTPCHLLRLALIRCAGWPLHSASEHLQPWLVSSPGCHVPALWLPFACQALSSTSPTAPSELHGTPWRAVCSLGLVPWVLSALCVPFPPFCLAPHPLRLEHFLPETSTSASSPGWGQTPTPGLQHLILSFVLAPTVSQGNFLSRLGTPQQDGLCHLYLHSPCVPKPRTVPDTQ